MKITGSTRVVAVIGDPVGHSLSPALHNAAFHASGLDWVMVALPVAATDGERIVDAARRLGLAGLAVTTPHKAVVAAQVDVVDPAASSLRSVNTVVFQPDGSALGASTDGDGFVASLRAAGLALDGLDVAVIGAGAAGRSVIDALSRARVRELVVINRNPTRARDAAALVEVARVGTVDDVAEVDLVVNATSVGMGSDPSDPAALPVDPGLFRAGQVVADLVYHPLDTALIVAARDRGATIVDGLGMLVHQAALQQRLWCGHEPDTQVMREAALASLQQRDRAG